MDVYNLTSPLEDHKLVSMMKQIPPIKELKLKQLRASTARKAALPPSPGKKAQPANFARKVLQLSAAVEEQASAALPAEYTAARKEVSDVPSVRVGSFLDPERRPRNAYSPGGPFIEPTNSRSSMVHFGVEARCPGCSLCRKVAQIHERAAKHEARVEAEKSAGTYCW